VAPPTIGGSTLGPDALEVVPATAGCGSPFHREVGSAVVLFPPEPVVLPEEGLCHQFFGEPACCLPSYTLAVAAQVKAMEHRTAAWAVQSRICVDRILELYTGVACSLCDPGWPRYSAREDHKWVVTVQEENCHYMWSACGRVLQKNMSAFEFCTSVANIVKTGELEEFFDLPQPVSDGTFTSTTTTSSTSTAPPPKPVVAVVRHSKQKRFRLRGTRPRPALATKASAVARGSESPRFVADLAASNSSSNASGKSTETSNETSSSNSSAGEDDEELGEDAGEDEDDGEEAEEVDNDDDDAEVANLTIPANATIDTNATEPQEVVESVQDQRPAACSGPAGNPCSLPFPPIAFSAEAHALSAVDEGQFGGYVRSATAVLALVGLVASAS